MKTSISLPKLETPVLRELAVRHENLRTDKISDQGKLDFQATVDRIKVILAEIRELAKEHGLPEELAMDDRWIFEELRVRN